MSFNLLEPNDQYQHREHAIARNCPPGIGQQRKAGAVGSMRIGYRGIRN
jgi:hypothetical protein